ncbi:VOC family protein [Roseiterribacter gracilis]|uniref:Glyoxalase n=1 Tax=Roseiterribacter gracilis TaxID=2812848 RepID=A0A8S8XA74_9PROT|nr:glyoxalase [Rhodospirillales bacterium TMPK1]
MFDHVSLGTSDLDRGAAFFSSLLACVGAGVTKRDAESVSFGPNGTEWFYLYQQAPGVTIAGGGTHVAFSAASTDQVDALCEAARANGATIRRPAGPRPDLNERYYGTVVVDFDGNVIEAVAYLK